ncbi:right-handed parallel beta-helix repeat-containing protein [Streptomyces sp. NPDC021093]|uniref:right-handed parallel beta-helix repeat-containing protein n=1 Tax=Streptomyces sp. NPDC021093 TaxID=3365112 RepID=UPI0037B482A0
MRHRTHARSARSARTTTALVATATASAAALAVLLPSPAQAAPAQAPASSGQTHYVDCSATAPGTGSRTRPWTTLAEANAHTFGPGDRLLFQRGATCQGSLQPKGSGAAGRPFTISDYGRASAGRAKLDGAGAHDVVLLANTQHIKLTNLEIVNSANPGSERNGVRLRLTDYGTARNFELAGLYLHDIRGGDFKTLTGSSAIHIAVEGKARASRYDGLNIHHNLIEDVDREGIYFKSTYSKRDLVGNQQDPNVYPGDWTPSTGVRIHHNTLKSLAGDGIKLDTTTGAVVERNLIEGFQLRSPSANAGIWTFNTDDTLVQHNDVSGGGNTHDGMSFDADGASKGTVFQYNYSHDNVGGFLLICPYSGAKTVDTVVRYNVSRNDGARLVQNCWGPILNTQIYNNSFYNKEKVPAHLIEDSAAASTQHELKLRNNLFVSEGTGGYAYDVKIPAITFEHNAFHGVPTTVPNPGGITANPLLRPDFRLSPGSPALAAGVEIPDNGGKDYFGNRLKPGTAPNIGAYAGPGVK